MRLLLTMLLLASASPIAAQRTELQTGTITLLPGFRLSMLEGVDSAPGRILRSDSSFVIHYDIGEMAGTLVSPERRGRYLWIIEHEVDGRRAYTALYQRHGKRRIATTIYGSGDEIWKLPANFVADVTRDQDIAEFLLIAGSYRPAAGPPRPISRPDRR